MDTQQRLVQFRLIVSLASLAYVFSAIHAIQYSALQVDDDSDIINSDSGSDSDMDENNTVNTEDPADTFGKSSGRWTDQEISLLLDYIEAKGLLNTTRGLTLKKAQFTQAQELVKSKDAMQCHYKWGHVHIRMIIDYILSH
jgi:hypothetical protein